MSPTWSGCADAARLRGDPLVATAPQAAGWLLIEHPGPWAREALAGSRLSPAVRAALSSAAAHAGYRILLIRRPGRARANADRARRWAVATTGPASAEVQWGEWRNDGDLLATLAHLDVAGRGVRAAVDPPGSIRASVDPGSILLVCTHGMHDACCAVRGRPVAAALAERWPAETWECSHLGGDRFAPNLLVLPDGTHYGNLADATAVEAVSEHLSGRLAIDHLRGVATMPPPAQAAAAALHRELGPWAPADVLPRLVHAEGPNGPWLVTLTSPVGQRQARVVAGRRRAARLTCHAAAATAATQYEVRWLAGRGEPERAVDHGS